MAAKCSEVATAVNRIMRLDSSDQEALLDVISDYFTNPTYDSDSDNCSDADTEPESDAESCKNGK